MEILWTIEKSNLAEMAPYSSQSASKRKRQSQPPNRPRARPSTHAKGTFPVPVSFGLRDECPLPGLSIGSQHPQNWRPFRMEQLPIGWLPRQPLQGSRLDGVLRIA